MKPVPWKQQATSAWHCQQAMERSPRHKSKSWLKIISAVRLWNIRFSQALCISPFQPNPERYIPSRNWPIFTQYAGSMTKLSTIMDKPGLFVNLWANPKINSKNIWSGLIKIVYKIGSSSTLVGNRNDEWAVNIYICTWFIPIKNGHGILYLFLRRNKE